MKGAPMCWTRRIGSGKVAGQAAEDLGEGRRPAGRGRDAEDARAASPAHRPSTGRGPAAWRRLAPWREGALTDHRDLAHDVELGADGLAIPVVAGAG